MKRSDTNKMHSVPRGYDVVITNLNDRLKICLVHNRDLKRLWGRDKTEGTRPVRRRGAR
jgi:hypothetical protein